MDPRTQGSIDSIPAEKFKQRCESGEIDSYVRGWLFGRYGTQDTNYARQQAAIWAASGRPYKPAEKDAVPAPARRRRRR